MAALSHAHSHPLTQRSGWGGEEESTQWRCPVCLLRMVLCIATNDSHSLSLDFGASLKSCRHLLQNAKKSHVDVVGVR